MSLRNYIKRINGVVQQESDTSFCGGMPRLPSSFEFPKCRLCGNDLTFYFQIKFPVTHKWKGHSCAIFSCTECVNDDYFIPQMIKGALKNVAIPAGFLESYQINFMAYIFQDRDAILRNDYKNRYIEFEQWDISAPTKNSLTQSFIAAEPSWLQEEEAPESYENSNDISFLFQLEEGFKFPREKDAPFQMTLGLDRKPQRSKNNFYKLFLANQIYFYGVQTNECEKFVYIITQRS